jgi:uncharacterized protein (TIGR02118 family)
MWLLKRKGGISPEQFRDHYERSHVAMAQKYIGHLLTSYVRNYKVETAGGPYYENEGFAKLDWDYDVITEWTCPSQEAFDEIMRIFLEPKVGKEFYEDEFNFMDRDRTLMFKCEAVDTGTGDGWATIKQRDSFVT